MKALVIGATGATGKDLVKQLVENDAFETVSLFVRRPLEYNNPKIEVHVVDFDHVEDWKNLLSGDVLFSCMGTTRKQAGSKKAQWIVDYDYQYNVAKAAKETGVNNYALVSSTGAKADSSFFYMQMKGKLEEDVKNLGFRRTVIVRPPSLIRKESDRWAERASVKILQCINKIGLFTSMAPVETDLVAKALIKHSLEGDDGLKVVMPEDLI